jgi:hypothetical protein
MATVARGTAVAAGAAFPPSPLGNTAAAGRAACLLQWRHDEKEDGEAVVCGEWSGLLRSAATPRTAGGRRAAPPFGRRPGRQADGPTRRARGAKSLPPRGASVAMGRRPTFAAATADIGSLPPMRICSLGTAAERVVAQAVAATVAAVAAVAATGAVAAAVPAAARAVAATAAATAAAMAAAVAAAAAARAYSGHTKHDEATWGWPQRPRATRAARGWGRGDRPSRAAARRSRCGRGFRISPS